MISKVLTKENSENKRLLVHYAAFLAIYTIYGYQVCPFLDSLSLTEIIVPALLAVTLHFIFRNALMPDLGLETISRQVFRVFKFDLVLFTVLGLAVALYNYWTYGFPTGSGSKVIVGFAVLGFYISLDIALRRDLNIAKKLRAKGIDFPITEQFLPYQTKFMLFSALNVAIMGVVCIMVALKDLVWVRKVNLSNSEVQSLILLDTSVVIFILSGYILLVVKQYSQKIEFALNEENKTLRAVQKGDFSTRVPITSNDEFGHLASLTNAMITKLKGSIDEVARNKNATIQAFIALAAKRDNETGLHLKRTQMYVRLLAEHMKDLPEFHKELTTENVETIVSAAPLHDIGKVGIPDAVLCKPGRLSPDEFEIMQTHTSIGAEALHEANETLGGSPFINTAIEIAEYHHEKWDGTGYPHRLTGENIPLSARVMAVADVYDAIRSKRVYKSAKSHDDARNILLEGSGLHFDPRVVDAFQAVEAKFEQIATHFGDETSDELELAQNVA